MVWLRVLAALALLGVAVPAGGDRFQDEFTGFGECLQQQVQPRAERIRREVYRDDAWVPAPKPVNSSWNVFPPAGMATPRRARAARTCNHTMLDLLSGDPGGVSGPSVLRIGRPIWFTDGAAMGSSHGAGGEFPSLAIGKIT